MADIFYLGDSSNCTKFVCNTTFPWVKDWLLKQSKIGFDTETNVLQFMSMQRLRLLQFGSMDGETAVLVQWSYLSDKDQKELLQLICDSRLLKIGHNLKFDYRILRNHGAIMENIWDTMASERVLLNGKVLVNNYKEFSLANVLLRRYDVLMDKTLQDQFSDDIITDEKLVYAAKDVIYLGKLYEDQRNEAVRDDLIQMLEPKDPNDTRLRGVDDMDFTVNEALLAFGDMEFNGMGIDVEKWKSNSEKAKPLIKEGYENLCNELRKEPFRTWLCTHDVNYNVKVEGVKNKKKYKVRGITSENVLFFTWGSKTGPKFILNTLFPSLKGTTIVKIKEYLQEFDPNAPCFNEKGKKININTSEDFKEYLLDIKEEDGWLALLKALATKNYELANKMVTGCQDLMVLLKEADLARLKGDLTIQPTNRSKNILPLLQLIDPTIDGTSAEILEEHKHKSPMFEALSQYYFYQNLQSKYGDVFLEKFLEPDGRVRPDYDILKETGRVSASKPAIQQIPAGRLPEGRQNDYRNAFIPKPGFVLSLNDYCSQELYVMGTASQEPKFMEAMEKGWDIHSVCAETMNPKEWKDGAEEGCEYFKLGPDGQPQKHKCGKCKAHKQGRKFSKDINFAIPYGMSAKGFAERKGFTLEEGEYKMNHYYNTFPGMKKMFEGLRGFAKQYGYTRTLSPLRRKRYFYFWKPGMKEREAASIGRKGMNTPQMYGGKWVNCGNEKLSA